MSSVTRYRQYAADCVRQAQNEDSSDDKNILLNVALAWLRLEKQMQELDEAESPPTAPGSELYEASAWSPGAKS